MAQTLKLKRTSVANKVPTTSNIEVGELAFNTNDKALFIRGDNNAIVTLHDEDTLHIDRANNRVGIGNASPAKNLHITDSTSPTIRFSRDNSFYWDIGHTSSDFQFISETGGTILHMEYDGNVGIGTDSPVSKLHVIENVNNSSALAVEGTTADAATIRIENDNTTVGSYASLFLRAHTADARIAVVKKSSASNDADIVFMVNDASVPANNEKLRIVGESGNIGIGTTDPQRKLEVVDNILIDGSSGANLYFRPNTSYSTAGNFGIFTTGLTSGTYESTMTIKGYGSGVNDVMTIKGLGNVGIGETDPDGELHVKGIGGGNGDIYLERTSGGVIHLQAQSAAGVIGTFSNHPLKLKANDTVRLEVATGGAITFNSAYTFPTSDGSANQVLTTDGLGSLTFADVSGGGGSTDSITDADGDTKIQVEESTDEDQIRFDAAGIERFRIGSDVQVLAATDFNITGTSRRLNFTAGSGTVRTTTANSLILATNNTTALTINSSQNATFAGDIYLYDTKGIYLGGSNDLQLYHNGSNSLISNQNGHLYIRQQTDDGDIIFQADDGAGGDTEYFRLDGGDSVTKISKTMLHFDNVKASFGNSEDMRIKHSGTDASIDNYTGDLYIRNNTDDKDILIQTDNGSGGTTTYMTFDGSNERIVVAKSVTHSDNVRGRYGASNDLQIYHDATDSRIENSTGNLYINNKLDDGDIIFQSDDGSGGLATYFKLDGGNTYTSVSKNFLFQDNVRADFGNDSDLRIYHTGTHSYIDENGTGNLYIGSNNGGGVYINGSAETLASFVDDGAVTLYYDGSSRLTTTSTGIQVDGPNGNVTIGAQNTTGLHIYTDRDRFYFNKIASYISNSITSYSGDFNLQRQESTKLTLTSTGVAVAGNLTATGSLSAVSLNTGHGDNELYAMNQNVRTSDSPSFNTLTVDSTSSTHNLILSNYADFLDSSSHAAIWITSGATGVDVFKSGEGAHLVFEGRRNSRNFYFKVGDVDAPQHIMHNNGKVGIGTGDITPSSTLQVSGSIQGTSFSDGAISGITFIDEDSFATNSATRVPTQQSIKAYVDAQVAGVVDSAPAALNTLNELAAALGDDASFSTTTSTALGNRLRVDTASQGLTGTQQANAITNLGITATKAELNLLDGVTATTTELNYTDGVTSNIQTQLNGKLSTSGTAPHANNLNATDDRDIAPEDLSYNDDLRIYFAEKGGLETGTVGSNYQDVLVLNSYTDHTGGDANALAFDKSEKKIYHYQADQAATNWGTAKTLAYTDDITLSTLSITATATELNYTDGVTSNIQTQLNGKVGTTGNETITGNKTFTGTTTAYNLYVDNNTTNYIRLYTEADTTNIADTFTDTTTDKSYIYFGAGDSSNDPGYIMHETSESETNEGVLHLVPSDDNATNDYVSIHGTNDADCIRLHTSGLIETGNNHQLTLKSGSGDVNLNDNVTVGYNLTVTGNIIVTGTVDGRDIATDGSKLDGIESGATADQTQSDINALGITQVGTITSGTWNGTAIASAYLDSDTAHLSGTQTFSGAKTFTGGIASDTFTGSAQPGSYIDFDDDGSGNGSNCVTINSLAGLNLYWDSNDNDGSSFKLFHATSEVLAVDPSGNLTLSGTVDGRDIATDGTKLDTIDTNADVTPSWVPSSDPSYLTGNQTITLSGDVSGSGTTSIAVTIADDSHNHVISNVDGLQSALDTKIQQGANAAAVSNFSDTVPAGGFRLLRVTGGTNRFSSSHHNLIQLPNSSGSNYQVQIAALTESPQIGWRGKGTSWSDWYEIYHEGHKPTYSELGTMAYSNLTGTPTIPTNNNQLTNGAGYITSSGNTSGTAGGLSGTPNISVGTISSGDITTTGIQMGTGTSNDIQADGKTAYIGSAIFGNSSSSNVPATAVHIKSSGTPALRIEDLDSTNQVYDFISNQGVGLSIVDQTSSITPLAFAHTTGNATFAGTVDGRDIATDGTKLDTIATNADVTPSWVPSSDPGYLTSSSTQSKYLRSDANDDFSGTLNYTPDTGTILSVDGQAILQRMTANGAITIGHDDAVIIAGGDTSQVMNANISNATETVFLGAEGGMIVYAFPNNDTTWTNRKQFSFDGANGLNMNSVFTVDINGNLSATTKSFDIEHPSKEGMRLRYGSLEGPENGVYVRGKSKEKVISLPDYWVDLIHEDSITVQLTAIGGGQNLYVEDIKDNKVYVNGENYFYYIQAERKDVERFEVEYEV